MGSQLLLVDDDKIQAVTRKAILERAGFSVRLASDGLDAIISLGSNEGGTVRMVITDHLMPRMNGPEFVGRLRHEGYTFPVLVLSGYGDAEAEYDSWDIDFRVKPFPPEQLISLVTYLMNTAERRSA